MLNDLFWIVPVCAIIALLFARIFFKGMMKESEGTDTMKRIAGHVRKGAMAYLRQQYRVVALVFLVLCALFAWMAYGPGLQNPWVWFAFLTGGFFSGLAGYIGMKTATYASARTANAARRSLNDGLKVAFRSGAVMGLVVVGLALLDISLWWLLLDYFVEEATETEKAIVITTTMLTFGMGASTQALFARVGGGIFTKAADVGADLVGKVEAGIPEDDPRNPATIADNVGDNVGDVAGMGADLYESYCGSILATAALGAAAFRMEPDAQFNAILAPMLIAAFGVILSLLGIFLVKTKEGASQQQLLRALDRGINVSSLLIVGASFLVIHLLGLSYWICGSVIVGLVTGIIIGKATEYYTSHAYKPTQDIAKSSETGPATVIIKGIGTGMISTAIPVLTIVAGIILSFLFAAEFSFANMSMGLYGVGIAAVGMLSTLGITLATDAYGPIADNAGGIAEMSGLDESVRQITDKLDSVGNTTAAIGKGFAIGSAALTALALFVSYAEAVHLDQIDILDNRVIIGIFIGGMLPFLFSSMTMQSVSKAAYQMIEEVRRQFKAMPGIMKGTEKPDYKSCVAISTTAALKEMLVPGIMAVASPLATGLILGTGALGGLLAGALVTGVLMAVFMSNSGGAWDNAKKYIEDGHHGGKGSEAHKAAVVGDTVGDPFKDTSGPSINILIKLMTIVSLVFAPLFLSIGSLL